MTIKNRGSHVPVLRAIAWAVVFVFTLTSVTWQTPVAYASAAVSIQTNSGVLPVDLAAVSIPAEIGKIRETYRGAGDKTVILIQDAHSVPDAQRSIRSVIEYFQKEYGVTLVGLEGASETLDSQIFRSFPDQKLLRKTFDTYFEKGELTGGTAAALCDTSKAGFYFGIEDWELYEKGIDGFLEAAKTESDVTALLNQRVLELDREKEAVYPKELLEVDRLLTQFGENKINLAQALSGLSQYLLPPEGSELAVLLKEIGSDTDVKSVPKPSLPVGDKGQRLGTEIKKIAEQVEYALKSQPSSPELKQDLHAFYGKRQAYQTSQMTPQAFALFLKDFATQHKIQVKVSRELADRVEDQKKLRDIEGTRLFADFQRYAEGVKEKMIRNSQSGTRDLIRQLNAQTQELALLKRLARLELSFEDWTVLKKMLSDRQQKIDQGLQIKFESHLRFYRIAEQRDEVFFRNIQSLMQKNFLHTPNFVPRTALLVAGGFHTEGLTQAFKEKGISYILVMPRIDSLPEQSLYREHMQGKVSWSDYFEVKNGKVNLYDAFVRATRDRLLGISSGAALNSLENSKHHQGRAIRDKFLGDKDASAQGGSASGGKEWRDRIIRDLAEQGRIAEASSYTRFIDELKQPEGGRWKDSFNLQPSTFDLQALRKKWLANIDRFGEGLKKLQVEGKLSESGIARLLKSMTIPAAADSPAVLTETSIDIALLPSIAYTKTTTDPVDADRVARAEIYPAKTRSLQGGKRSELWLDREMAPVKEASGSPNAVAKPESAQVVLSFSEKWSDYKKYSTLHVSHKFLQGILDEIRKLIPADDYDGFNWWPIYFTLNCVVENLEQHEYASVHEGIRAWAAEMRKGIFGPRKSARDPFLDMIEKIRVQGTNGMIHGFQRDKKAQRDYFYIRKYDESGRIIPGKGPWPDHFQIAPIEGRNYRDASGRVRFQMINFELNDSSDRRQGVLSGFLKQLPDGILMRGSEVINPETILGLMESVLKQLEKNRDGNAAIGKVLGKYQKLRKMLPDLWAEVRKGEGIYPPDLLRLLKSYQDMTGQGSSLESMEVLFKTTPLGKATVNGGFETTRVWLESPRFGAMNAFQLGMASVLNFEVQKPDLAGARKETSFERSEMRDQKTPEPSDVAVQLQGEVLSLFPDAHELFFYPAKVKEAILARKADRDAFEKALIRVMTSKVSAELNNNLRSLAAFSDSMLPQMGFSPENLVSLKKTLDLNGMIAEASVISDPRSFHEVTSNVDLRNLSEAAPVLRNYVAYLHLDWPLLIKENPKEALAEKQRIFDLVSDGIIEIADIEPSYILLRQILKETILLNSSKSERLEELLKIIDAEVGVKHGEAETSDLMNLAFLQRALEGTYKRRPTLRDEKTGDLVFNPKVTAALAEVKALVEELQGVADFTRYLEISGLESQDLERIKEAERLFSVGRPLDSLSLLTSVREDLKKRIRGVIREARRLDQSDVRRYGDHVNEARKLVGQALKLTEADIILEEKIVDHYRDAFSSVKDALNREVEAAVQEKSEINSQRVKDCLLTANIIVRNITYFGIYDGSLERIGRQLLELAGQTQHSGSDYLRILGLMGQVQMIMKETIDQYAWEYPQRVEAIQKQKGQENVAASPESIAFVEELLRPTLMSQFSEKHIYDLKSLFMAATGTVVSHLKEDPSLREEVVRVTDVMEKTPVLTGTTYPLEGMDPGVARILGAKVYGLVLLKQLGLKVPDGFVLRSIKGELEKPVADGKNFRSSIEALQTRTGKRLGDRAHPLLLSLRAAFPLSLAGEFPTVVNVGINDEVFEVLKAEQGEEFALRVYIRFKNNFARLFYPKLDLPLVEAKDDVEVLRFKFDQINKILAAEKIDIPQDPWDQINRVTPNIAIGSLNDSVRNLLDLHGVGEEWLVNVIVQEMVFGDLNQDSYTAVVHTRNTMNGNPRLDIELAYGSQGQDLVGDRPDNMDVFRNMPEKDERSILQVRRFLEEHFGPVEFEITNENGQMYFLQVRKAKLNPSATVRALRDLYTEGLLEKKDWVRLTTRALSLIPAEGVDLTGFEPVARGMPVVEGKISGPLAFSIEEAQAITRQEGIPAVLFLINRPPRQIQDFYDQPVAVVTKNGGTAQHYAVWARHLRRTYVTSVNDMEIDAQAGILTLGGRTFRKGDWMTVDGVTGNIYEGNLLAGSQVVGTGTESAIGPKPAPGDRRSEMRQGQARSELRETLSWKQRLATWAKIGIMNATAADFGSHQMHPEVEFDAARSKMRLFSPVVGNLALALKPSRKNGALGTAEVLAVYELAQKDLPGLIQALKAAVDVLMARRSVQASKLHDSIQAHQKEIFSKLAAEPADSPEAGISVALMMDKKNNERFLSLFAKALETFAGRRKVELIASPALLNAPELKAAAGLHKRSLDPKDVKRSGLTVLGSNAQGVPLGFDTAAEKAAISMVDLGFRPLAVDFESGDTPDDVLMQDHLELILAVTLLHMAELIAHHKKEDGPMTAALLKTQLEAFFGIGGMFQANADGSLSILGAVVQQFLASAAISKAA